MTNNYVPPNWDKLLAEEGEPEYLEGYKPPTEVVIVGRRWA